MNRANKDDKRKEREKDQIVEKKRASSRLNRKKRGAPKDEDDEDVDSKGNIRGLIAYSDESDSDVTESESESGRHATSHI